MAFLLETPCIVDGSDPFGSLISDTIWDFDEINFKEGVLVRIISMFMADFFADSTYLRM